MRKSEVKRKTKETEIIVKLDIDGTGDNRIKTSIGFLDHMLDLFSFHGLFDLEITAKGDLDIDRHHTNEDIGIVLGEAFKKALGGKEGIKRFGSSTVPMEEVVANVTVDLSGRSSFRFFGGGIAPVFNEEKDYSFKDAGHFLESFANHLGMNLNIRLEPFNPDLHTTLEPVFKALGIALDMATQIDPRRKGIPSTKGIID